jgi:cobyrinic acid a,c-diamide synthase
MSGRQVIIAGTHSGVGKTSVSLAVMAGLKKAGYRVQAYKVGPDYIDPSYHEVATGQPAHNLDDWMMGTTAVQGLFQQTSQDCDIAVIEGVMGLFDGFGTTNDEGSTAKIAKLLNAPVILVVDAGHMARSVSAVIKGYQTLDPEIKICGVILNRVASMNHWQMLKESIEHYNQCPILGAIFRDEKISIPERHLGLQPASENPVFLECLESLIQLTEVKPEKNSSSIDLTAIFNLAQQHNFHLPPVDFFPFKSVPSSVRFAYAKDRAFHFYYQANLDFLKRCGADLIAFSPLEDDRLPENVSGLYFGGGFPEIYAKELENNESMRDSIREAVESGMPTYAECGGLMYLTQGIKTLDGKTSQMVGVIPGFIEMTPKLVNFGYCENELLKDCCFGKKGERFRGHEFHYSRWDAEGEGAIHQVVKKRRQSSRPEGYHHGNLLASYVHCHFLSYPQRALYLLETARSFAKTTTASETQLK